MAVVDFDGTLVDGDSLRDLMRAESLWRDLRLGLLGALLLLLTRILPPRYQLRWRSRFKRRLLELMARVPTERFQAHVELYRRRLNTSVIRAIERGGYERIVVVSASLEGFIHAVLEGVLKADAVIACAYPKEGQPFVTCWHAEKVRRLEGAGFLPHVNMHLYTDSMDDLPLVEYASRVFWVKRGRLHETPE
jgi:phosphoserine phosphatase